MTTLESTVKRNTSAISVSAAPHARSVAALNGVYALYQISWESDVLVPLRGFGLIF